jgi:protein-disulfide isomerase
MQPRRPRKKRGVTTKQARMSWGPFIIVGVVAVAVVVAVVLGSAALRGGGSDVVIPPGISERTAPQQASVLGAEDAPVTIVEYFRFDCPHCADFALGTAPLIEKEYIDNNSVRFEARPLAAEGEILAASEAVECAGEQGRYWDYHDVLFANFREDPEGAYKSGRLKEYAAKLGLDTGSFNSCLDSHKYQQTVIDESKQAASAGLTGTPTFFIGLTDGMKTETVPYAGEKTLIGAQPYEAFKAAIDEVLNKAQ